MTTHPFLTAAETRAAHLREIDTHMTALELATVALTDVRREIAELEAAMAVYRRISTEVAAGNGATPPASKPRAAKAAPGTKPPTGARRTRRTRRSEPPSFKEFALTHLDSLAQEAGDGHADNGARARALQPIRARGGRRAG